MEKSKNILRVEPYFVIFVLAIAVWAYCQNALSYSFFYKEQNQLFLMSADYLLTYFQRPAWAACLVGDFLTQFFYYMYAGAAIFATLILFLGATIYKAALGIVNNRPIALFVAMLGMGIETTFNFNPDFRISSLLCVQGGVASFLFYRLVDNCRITCRLLAMLVVAILSAWMFNFGFFVFVALVVLLEVSLVVRQKDNSIAAAGKVGYVFIPLCAALLLAYYFASAAYPVDPATCRSYPGVGKFGLPNPKVEQYLEVDNLYYFGRHDELIKVVEQMENPSEEVVFYYYLVMARRGLLPYKLRSITPVNLGTLYEIGPKSTPMEIKMVNELYFALGDMTLAEREALLSCVFSHDNRNVRMIKRLAEANLVAGDDEAAMKYLRILDKTLVYSKWSKVNRPGNINASLKDLQRYAIKDDAIRLNANCRDVLTSLLKANPKNHIALDYLLCTDYLVGAREMFVSDMETYYIPHYGMPTEEMYRALYKGGERSEKPE
ncbi:MAG: DUF6057 family protein [Prevotella sp.]